MTDIGDWFNTVPFFTRYWLAGTVGLSVIGRFGLINPYYLFLLAEPLKQFQIWRLVTAVFYYPLTPGTGFHFLINCYFLYNYSKLLESGVYAGRPADYFFMLLFNWICCVIVGLIAEIPLLMDPMVLSVLYVWCQLNQEVIVNFWFGTRFKAMYLPWVLLAFNVVISGGGIMEIVGILVGHLYFFLTYKYPQDFGGASLLTTPSILKYYFPDSPGGVHGFGIPPQSRAPNPAQNRPTGMFGRHDWGRGQVLGGN